MNFPELFFAHQSALSYGMFLTIPSALPATRTHHIRSGNIQVLENCPNLTNVNFYFCEKIEGKHTSNELS